MIRTTKNTPSPDAEDLANMGQAIYRQGMMIVDLSMQLETKNAILEDLQRQISDLTMSKEEV